MSRTPHVGAMPDPVAIAEAMLRLTTARGSEKSICPSEVARALAGAAQADWRPLMGPIRATAARLATEGRIEILRKGRAIAPEAMHGVIRLRAAKP